MKKSDVTMESRITIAGTILQGLFNVEISPSLKAETQLLFFQPFSLLRLL